MLRDNSDETIRRNLIKKYNLFFSHWRDFNLLVAALGMIGLAIVAIDYEENFKTRGPDGVTV